MTEYATAFEIGERNPGTVAIKTLRGELTIAIRDHLDEYPEKIPQNPTLYREARTGALMFSPLEELISMAAQFRITVNVGLPANKESIQ